MLYMVTNINIPQMLAYIYHTWILWVTTYPILESHTDPQGSFQYGNMAS